MRFEFGLHMPVNVYQNPLRFAGVIREKPIFSKYIITSINAFKSKLDRLRYTRMGFFMD